MNTVRLRRQRKRNAGLRDEGGAGRAREREDVDPADMIGKQDSRLGRHAPGDGHAHARNARQAAQEQA
jgi:hypothetical protein